MRGQDLAEYGCCWIKDNHPSFLKLMHLVHIEVDKGNPCVQQGDILSLAKEAGIDIGDYPGIRRDRSLWPVITRYMVMLRPKLAKSLQFRKSKVDEVDMADAWHRLVNAGTFFLASSWKEAKHLCEINDASAQ